MVYFIQSGLTGPIKIGYTAADRDPLARLRTMQTGNPELLQLLAVIPDAGRKTEKWLHRAFAYCRVRGEWFQPDGTLLRLIERIQGGDDLNALAEYVEAERPEAPRPRPGRPSRRAQNRVQRAVADGSLTIRHVEPEPRAERRPRRRRRGLI